LTDKDERQNFTGPLFPTWSASVRLEQLEWLDLGLGSPAEVAANLTEMWRINRYLGGLHALTVHLYPRLAAVSEPQTLIDLGAGSAEMLPLIARWAKLRGLRLRLFALDRALRHLAVARARTLETPEVRLLCADAGRLPFTDTGVDFVISSLLLHHLTPETVVECLRAAYASARRGIVMSDLVRGWWPYLAFKVIQPIFARQTLTRHDGALSIRRAYTPSELRELAVAAGLSQAKIYLHWPWRMTLVADKCPVGPTR